MTLKNRNSKLNIPIYLNINFKYQKKKCLIRLYSEQMKNIDNCVLKYVCTLTLFFKQNQNLIITEDGKESFYSYLIILELKNFEGNDKS